MSKRTFFFVLSLLIALPLWSQPPFQSLECFSQVPDPVNKTIIRELQFPASISYVETTGPHYFVYHDGDTNMLIRVEIGGNLYVNDFVIVNDTVFFCGRNSNGNIGFFGHFLIQDFFFTAQAQGYTVTDFMFLTSQGWVQSFNKMVTYSDWGVRKFAAIGQSTSRSYVVAELDYNPNVPVYQYNIGELDLTYNEDVLDIAVTEDYVVTAGFKKTNLPDPLLCIRVYMRSSMFANNGPQDIAYYYYESGQLDTYFGDSQLVLTYMQDDAFAVATYWTFQNSSITKGTYVGIYRIGGNNNITELGSIRIDQSPNYLNGGWTLRGMTPEGPTSKFYLLQNAEYLSEDQTQLVNMVIELDYNVITTPPLLPSGGTFNMLYRSDPYLQSIDARGNITDFMTNGYYHAHPNDPHYLAYYYSTTVNSNSCHNFNLVWYDNITMVQAQNSNTPFVVTSGVGQTFQPYTGALVHFPIEIGCTVPNR